MIFCERIIKLILSKEVGLLISALIKTLREKKKKKKKETQIKLREKVRSVNLLLATNKDYFLWLLCDVHRMEWL